MPQVIDIEKELQTLLDEIDLQTAKKKANELYRQATARVVGMEAEVGAARVKMGDLLPAARDKQLAKLRGTIIRESLKLHETAQGIKTALKAKTEARLRKLEPAAPPAPTAAEETLLLLRKQEHREAVRDGMELMEISGSMATLEGASNVFKAAVEAGDALQAEMVARFAITRLSGEAVQSDRAAAALVSLRAGLLELLDPVDQAQRQRRELATRMLGAVDSVCYPGLLDFALRLKRGGGPTLLPIAAQVPTLQQPDAIVYEPTV
jgi:hypothetical protein